MNEKMIEHWVQIIADEIEKRLTLNSSGNLIYLTKESFVLPDNTEKIWRKKLRLKNSIPLYVLPNISLDSLARLALLQPQTESEKEFVSLLSKGEKVIVIKEGRTYQDILDSARYGFKKRILEYENMLYLYGIEFLSLKEKE